jgi:hypothetical protein
MDDPVFEDGDLGNEIEDGKEIKPTVDEFDPDFLEKLAADAKTPEEIEAEEQAALKAAEDKVKADEDAAAKLLEEQEAEKKGFVPKGRFNEINEEKKAALERAAAIEEENKKLKEELAKGKTKEPEPDPLDLLEDKVVELYLIRQAALTDFGLDSQEYKDATRAYNKTNRELMAMEADRRANKAVTGLRSEDKALADTKAALNEVAEKSYEIYPFLNKNGEDFDEQAINDVLEYRNDLIATGNYKPEVALQKAIDKLAPLHAARIEKILPVDNDKVKQIKEARERSAREKAALATKGQAPDLKGRLPNDGFKTEVDKISVKEVGEMSEEQLAVLLGNA